MGIVEEVVITKHICQGQHFWANLLFSLVFSSFQAFVKMSKRFGRAIYSGNLTPLLFVLWNNKYFSEVQSRNICYLQLKSILNI